MAEKGQTKTNEQKRAGVEYIINFYNNVQALNQHWGIYTNTRAFVMAKHGSNMESITDEQTKNSFISAIQNVRFYINLVHIQINAIAQGTKKIDLKINNVTEISIYKKLSENKAFVMNYEHLTDYVQFINNVLMQQVVKDLLKTAQDIYKEISS